MRYTKIKALIIIRVSITIEGVEAINAMQKIIHAFYDIIDSFKKKRNQYAKQHS